jgi:MAD (mothers against decapentaplegic) family protein 4
MPTNWCTIHYYELDFQVGDAFKVKSNYGSVLINGGFDTTREDLFCVGVLTNVQRTEASERARMHIGRGVQIDSLADGDIYCSNLSEQSVFIESYYLDREAGRSLFDAVNKIYPGSKIKVFDLKQCYKQMHQQAVSTYESAREIAMQTGIPLTGKFFLFILNGILLDFSSSNQDPIQAICVDELKRLCTLRFSLVKGWGPDYPRKTIKETPCWFEMQLNRPLQLLDRILNSLNSYIPNTASTSSSSGAAAVTSISSSSVSLATPPITSASYMSTD